VIPYVTDQLAMARLPRATYATMVALLPALATLIGIVVLAQIPSWLEVAGLALVVAGVGLHGPRHAGDDVVAEAQAGGPQPLHRAGEV
jgi:inner membrane transporter RhtA